MVNVSVGCVGGGRGGKPTRNMHGSCTDTHGPTRPHLGVQMPPKALCTDFYVPTDSRASQRDIYTPTSSHPTAGRALTQLCPHPRTRVGGHAWAPPQPPGARHPRRSPSHPPTSPRPPGALRGAGTRVDSPGGTLAAAPRIAKEGVGEPGGGEGFPH